MNLSERLIPGDHAGSKSLVGTNLGTIDGPVDSTPEEAARAMRAVAVRARNVDDVRLLLEVFGLIEPSAPRTNPKKGVCA